MGRPNRRIWLILRLLFKEKRLMDHDASATIRKSPLSPSRLKASFTVNWG